MTWCPDHLSSMLSGRPLPFCSLGLTAEPPPHPRLLTITALSLSGFIWPKGVAKQSPVHK